MLKTIARSISMNLKPIICYNLNSNFTDHVMFLHPSKITLNLLQSKDPRWVKKFGEDHNKNTIRREMQKFEHLLENYGITVNSWTNIHASQENYIFANQWFTTLGENDLDELTLVIYPTENPIKLNDSSYDFIEELHRHYKLLIDLTPMIEKDHIIDTPSNYIFDRKNRQVFSCITDPSEEAVLDALILYMNKNTSNPWKAITFRLKEDAPLTAYNTNMILNFMSKHAVGLLELDREIVFTSLTNIEAVAGVSANEIIARLY